MTAVTSPGTKLFAPQARLVDADTNKVVGITADGKSVPNPANVDLVSARVTLAINNVCQLQVVLNNQRNHDGLPLAPPWKYNGLSAIRFGQRLRLDIRYGADPWVKMILARVTDLQFGFPSGGAAQLTLIGEDLLSLLKTTPTDEHPYSNRTEDFIVRDVLSRSDAETLGLTFTTTKAGTDPLAGPLVPWPELQPLRSVTHPAGTSYLQFLQGIAERMDFEMFVDFTQRRILDSDAPPTQTNAVKLHFEPARSLLTPTTWVDLVWGTNLIELTPKIKVWDLLTEVKFGGTKHGQRARVTGSVRAGDDVITQDLKEDPEYSFSGQDAQGSGSLTEKVEMLDAGEVRESFFAKEGKAAPNTKKLDSTNLDFDRAKLQATAMLRSSARTLLTAEGSTIGFPELRPGMYVRLGGLYPPFDGFYYVTQTVHSLDSSGYRTQFSVRRPGLLDPAAYPGTETPS